MYFREANEILRRAVLTVYFEPGLSKAGYSQIEEKHPEYGGKGFSKGGLLRIFFDLSTGLEYPDGDEWFITEFFLPLDTELPDRLKSPDYFTRYTSGEKVYWRHRELVRFRYGKVKRLQEAFDFIIRKSEELTKNLQDASVTEKSTKSKEEQGK